MRAYPGPHVGVVASSSEYKALWRCDEAAGANFTDEQAGARTLTQNGAPGAAASIFGQTDLTGARTFNGSTQYGSRAAADGDEAFFQTGVWGWNAWVTPASLAAIGALFSYSEWSSPKTLATYVQAEPWVNTDGSLRFNWHDAGGSFRNNASPAGLFQVGVPACVGMAIDLDPEQFGAARQRFYFNGVCVQIVKNRPLPGGGTSSRWTVGCSRDGGTAVGTPGRFFNGTIDDLVITKFAPTHEWFREVYARGKRDFFMRALEQGNQSTEPVLTEVYARALVEVGDTSFVAFDDKVNLTDLDLSSINGIDFLKSIEWGENVDDAGATAKIELWPRYGFYNMSPFVPSAGSLNDNPLDGLWTVPRRVKIEVAVVPCGTCRENADPYWWMMFDGWTVSASVQPGSDVVTISAIDKIGPLQDVWVQSAKDGTDRTYGSGGGTAIETVLQQMIDDSDPARFDILLIDDSGAGGKIQITVLDVTVEKGNGRPHLLLTGDPIKVTGTVNYNGTAYTVDAGSTAAIVQTLQVSGGALAPESVGTMQALAALSYLGGKPTLVCPVSPGFNLFQSGEVASKSVAQALEDLLDTTIGWRCAFRWDDVHYEQRLKLYDPRSSYGSSSRCADNIYSPDEMNVRRDDQRDVGIVEFGKNSAKDNVGERTPFLVFATASSERSGGYRAFRFGVGPDSLVTDSVAAQKLVDTMVGDLKKAVAEGALPLPFDPSLELHDELVLNNEVLTATQMATSFGDQVVCAIADIRHSVTEGQIRTAVKPRKLQLGGALDFSVARAERHLRHLNLKGHVPGVGRSAPPTPAAPGVVNMGLVNVTRMIQVTWAMPAGDLARAWTHTEVHVSTTTGFTPSSATLKAVMAGTQAVVAHGVGVGVQAFVKIIHRDEMGNRSAASAQTAFTS